MIRYLMTISLIFLSACGDSNQAPCGGNRAAGLWRDGYNAVLLNSDCTGADTVCDTEFTWEQISSVELNLYVTETSGLTGCPGLGKVSCNYLVEGDELRFNCGSGLVIYRRY